MGSTSSRASTPTERQMEKRPPAWQCLSGYYGPSVQGWLCFISTGQHSHKGCPRFVFQEENARQDGSRMLRIVRVRWEGKRPVVFAATLAERARDAGQDGSLYSRDMPLSLIPSEVLLAFRRADWESLRETWDGKSFDHKGCQRVERWIRVAQ